MSIPRALVALAVILTTSTPVLAFKVSSSSVGNEKWDKKFIADSIAGCDGQNVSPAISWSGVPAGAKSLALTMYDPDAPTGSGWWHWQVWNIPVSTNGFEEGKVPVGVTQGRADVGREGYLGPCPSPGSGLHHYKITVYALKVDKLDLDPGKVSSAYVGFTLHGNTVAKASVVYTYRAHPK